MSNSARKPDLQPARVPLPACPDVSTASRRTFVKRTAAAALVGGLSLARGRVVVDSRAAEIPADDDRALDVRRSRRVGVDDCVEVLQGRAGVDGSREGDA